MNLYPAIDLFEGKVVRLTRGDFNACTVYSEDPLGMARGFVEDGAKWLHVVDLEGAKSGMLTNEAAVRSIAENVTAKVQFGGGLRTVEDIEMALELGVARVVVGTKALNRSFLEIVVQKFGDRVAAGLDVYRGRVKTAGWLHNSEATVPEALKLFNKIGVKTLIYTDIDRDGMLEGPNFTELGRILEKTGAQVILSGGVGELKDIEKCRAIKEPNFEGIIIGKALYDKRFTLTEAFRAVSRTQGA